LATQKSDCSAGSDTPMGSVIDLIGGRGATQVFSANTPILLLIQGILAWDFSSE